MLNKYMKKNNTGFTLLEIMIVVVIIGILAAIVVPKIMNRPDQARIIKVKTDIENIESALDLYKLDNGIYPSTTQGLMALVKEPTIGAIPTNWQGYLNQLPRDPWGNPYHYVYPGKHGQYDIYTLGADNAKGGVGMNKDRGNWK